jgi:UDP-glucose 4-epimerase
MSSTAVYGARPSNSAFLSEDNPLLGSRENGYARDLVEIEAFCNGYSRQYPHVSLTTLRYPNIIGPSVDTPMTRFLSEPLAPVLLGFDPMMQLIHEEDVSQSIVHCMENDNPGVFNVAAEGVLPLSKLLALSGKIPLPMLHFLAYWGKDLLGAGGLRLTRYIPFDLDYIRYPWVADLTRMRDILGYQPVYASEEALREFAGQQRMRIFIPESSELAYDEARLRDTLERRRRIREHQSANIEGQVERNGHE